MTRNAVRPAPWPKVVLATVPGLLATLAATFPGMPNALFLTITLALGVAGIVLAGRRRSAAAFPVWALVALGLLAFVGLWLPAGLFAGVREIILPVTAAAALVLAAARVFRRERPGPPPVASLVLAGVGAVAYASLGHDSHGFPGDFSWLLLALPAAAGLLLAPTHGLPAVLVLLYYGTFIMSFDVEHVIYFQQAPAWSDSIKTAMPLLWMVLLPGWVLRARSLSGQAAGLVVPVALYYLILVAGLATASAIAPDWDHVLRIAQPVIRLLAILAACGAVYGWLWRGVEPDAAGDAAALDHWPPQDPLPAGQ